MTCKMLTPEEFKVIERKKLNKKVVKILFIIYEGLEDGRSMSILNSIPSETVKDMVKSYMKDYGWSVDFHHCGCKTKITLKED